MATMDRHRSPAEPITALSAAVRRTAAIALWTARGAAAVLLVLGIYIWAAEADQLITVHVVFGVVLVLSLWTLAAIAARAGVSPAIVAIAVAWSFGAVALGWMQADLLTGDWHWTVQLLHLAIAMAMVAWCQVLAVLTRNAGRR